AAGPERVDAMLLRGELDLAIGGAATTDGHLLVERLGEIAIALACARRHRLARTTRGDVLEDTRFAVCPEVDAWPGERPRRVAIVSTDLGAVLDACAAGDLAAVVPAALARRRGLHVVKTPGFPARPLYLTRRRPLRAGWLDSIAGAIRERAHASALDARR
ncbi:MAG: substrate-binding domain-containing protein, partial [Deltaproteobacteria bacterium]|nr:substrate-binding domain-containing protein [Kofleriaceae bacterium]